MASVRFPEAFVSYIAAPSALTSVLDELREVMVALPQASTNAETVGLLSRQRLLEIQAAVAEGDREFQALRHEAALARYRAAARLVLAFLDAQARTWRPPRSFELGAPHHRMLEEVSVHLLANLQPSSPVASIVALPGGQRLDPAAFGAEVPAQVTPRRAVSDEVLQRAEVGATAMREGRWNEAAEQLGVALQGLGASQEERELQAALLLDLGAVEVQRNQPDAALSHLSHAREQFTALGDELGAAEALHNTALARLKGGQGQQAIDTLHAARTAAGAATLRNLLVERLPAPAPPGTPTPAPPGGGGVVVRPPDIVLRPPIGRFPIDPGVIGRISTEFERRAPIGRGNAEFRLPISVVAEPRTEPVPASTPSVEQLAAGLGSDDLAATGRSVRAPSGPVSTWCAASSGRDQLLQPRLRAADAWRQRRDRRPRLARASQTPRGGQQSVRRPLRMQDARRAERHQSSVFSSAGCWR